MAEDQSVRSLIKSCVNAGCDNAVRRAFRHQSRLAQWLPSAIKRETRRLWNCSKMKSHRVPVAAKRRWFVCAGAIIVLNFLRSSRLH